MFSMFAAIYLREACFRNRFDLLRWGNLRHHTSVVRQSAKTNRDVAPRQQRGKRVDVATDPAVARARGFYYLAMRSEVKRKNSITCEPGLLIAGIA